MAARGRLKRLLIPSVESDVRVRPEAAPPTRQPSRSSPQNLRQLLLAAPLGGKPVLGIDPGQRTGCKFAVGRRDRQAARAHGAVPGSGRAGHRPGRETRCWALCRKHRPAAIAVGNGTDGRETEAFARELVGFRRADRDLRGAGQRGRRQRVLGLRGGARGIPRPGPDGARRGLASPGACRIRWPSWSRSTPSRSAWASTSTTCTSRCSPRKLDEVVESCVNARGRRAQHRQRAAARPRRGHRRRAGQATSSSSATRNGAFRSRKQLLEVPGLGPRAFEQAAGFLRVRGGAHPLDATAVHPERYALVERMAADLGVELGEPRGQRGASPRRSTSQRYVDRRRRRADPARHPRRAEEARARPARRVRAARVPRRRAEARGPEAGHGARGRRDQRHGVRRLRGRGRAPGRAGARLAARRPLRARTPRRWSRWATSSGAGDGGRPRSESGSRYRRAKTIGPRRRTSGERGQPSRSVVSPGLRGARSPRATTRRSSATIHSSSYCARTSDRATLQVKLLTLRQQYIRAGLELARAPLGSRPGRPRGRPLLTRRQGRHRQRGSVAVFDEVLGHRC